MRVAAMLAALGLSLPPAAAQVPAPLGVNEAVALLARHCIDTDAKSDRAQAAVAALSLPAGSTVETPIRGGTGGKGGTGAAAKGAGAHGIGLKVGLGGGGVLELRLAAGAVRSCALDVALADAGATFTAMQARWQLGGSIDDYDAASNTWVEIQSPGGTALAATFIFRAVRSLDGKVVGSMSARVLPAVR